MPQAKPIAIFADASIQPTRVHLRILATTDIHMRLDDRAGTGGLSRIAPLVRQQRQAFRNTLLFDNGDLLEGTPLGDEIARNGLSPDDAHPAITALNMMRYDAITLGNHDFAHGLPFLRRALRDVECPVVVSNAHPTAGKAPWSHCALIRRSVTDENGAPHAISIGVFGVLPPQTTDWMPALAKQVTTEDVVIAANRAIIDLRAQGADIIIALSHGGEGGDDGAHPENASDLIASLPGVDAVIAGHTHELLIRPATDTRAAIVMPGFGGSHLAALRLELFGQPGSWRVRCKSVELIPAGKETCPKLAAIAESCYRRFAERLESPIAHSTNPLNTHFAQLGRCPGLWIIDEAVCAHVGSTLPGNTLPIISVNAPFATGGRNGPDNYVLIEPGPIRLADLSLLYPFRNVVAAIPVTGTEISQWLELAARHFNQITPGGQTEHLINNTVPGYLFDIIPRLDYEIDLSRPPADPAATPPEMGKGRIRNLSRRNTPVRAGDRFLLVTNSYRMAASQHYARLTAGKTCQLPDHARLPVRDIILRHLSQHSEINPCYTPHFRFRAPAGSAAIFDTSPKADSTDSPIQAESLGLTDRGFQRLQLRF